MTRKPFDPDDPHAQQRARGSSARKVHHHIAKPPQVSDGDDNDMHGVWTRRRNLPPQAGAQTGRHAAPSQAANPGDETVRFGGDSWRGTRRRHRLSDQSHSGQHHSAESQAAARHRREDRAPGGRHRAPERPSSRRPTDQQFRRRRIAATMLATFILLCAAGVGVAVQKLANASHETPQAHNTVKEPADYAPTEAVAIPPANPNVQVTPAVARIPKNFHPIRKVPKAGQNKTIELKSGKHDRRYIINVPRAAKPYNKDTRAAAKNSKPLPLIFSFHGYREQADQMARYTGLAGKDAIVVYPQGLGNAWEGAPYARVKPGEDVRFVRDILDAVSSTYQVDANRIYATGMSNGGGFVGKLACEMPKEFAAFAAVSAAYYSGTWRACAEKGADPKRPDDVRFKRSEATPLLDIHGRKDETIRYSGGSRYEDEYLGAFEFAQLYASRAHCVGAPITTRVTDAVQRVQWPNCGSGMEVTHLAIGDAGHTWMGERTGEAGAGAADRSRERRSNAVTATSEVTAFFDAHSRS